MLRFQFTDEDHMSSVPYLSSRGAKRRGICFWKEREKQIPRFARNDKGMSSRGARRRGICSWERTLRLILVAVVISGAAMPARAVAQDTGFVTWPRELASRAPGLADGIAREFGQRPRMIRFGGRDTMQILFWNPKIWQDDMESKVLPEKSMPIVRAATKDDPAYVWTT